MPATSGFSARALRLTSELGHRQALALLVAGAGACLLGWILPRVPITLVVGGVLGACFGAIAWLRPRWATWFYVGVLVLVPTYVGVTIGALGDWTPANALGLILLLMLLGRRGIQRERWHLIDWSVLAYLLVTTIPFAFKGATPTWTFKYVLFTSLQYGAPYVVFRSASADTRGVERLIKVILFWTGVVTLFAIAETITGINLFTDLNPQIYGNDVWALPVFRGNVHRAAVSFSHPIALGAFAALVLPLAMWLVQRCRGWQAVAVRGGAIGVAVTLLLSLSRGPWVGALLAFLLPAAIQPSGKQRMAGLGILGLLACVGLYLSGLTPLTQLINDSFDPGTLANASIVYRQNLPALVLDAWTRSFFFGYGDMSANGILQDVSIDNFYLGSLILTGVVGTGAFVLFAMAVLHWLWKLAHDLAAVDVAGSGLATVLLGVFVGQLLILATVAMIGSGSQVFWGFAGISAGFTGQAAVRSADRGRRRSTSLAPARQHPMPTAEPARRASANSTHTRESSRLTSNRS